MSQCLTIVVFFTFVMLLSAGCASLQSKDEMIRAARHVESATGVSADALLKDAQVASTLTTELLRDGLTADEAVRVALLNNPRLQVSLLRLGIGRAELVQSSLFSNPTLSVSLRWPDGGGLANLQTGLAQNIAELWQLPYRKQSARRELDRTILDVAREASMLALDTRIAYWRAVRDERERGLAGESLTLGRKVVELALSRRDAGAGSDVDVNLASSRQMDVELRLRNASLAVIEARSALAKLLGLTTPPGELTLVDALAEPITWTLTPNQVIASAMENRLDVQATRMAADAAFARVGFEKSRLLRSLEVGVSAERSARNPRGNRNWLSETAFASAQAGPLTPPSLQPRDPVSTDWVIGPEISLELPIFDQNQAQIAKAECVHQQALSVLDALERELTQDAHVAFGRANTALENARFYKESVLPLRETGLSLSQGAYGAGRATLLSVQEAQRLLLEARAGYIDALMNHALAVVELERVAGRPFSKLLESAVATPVGTGLRNVASQQAEDEQ